MPDRLSSIAAISLSRVRARRWTLLLVPFLSIQALTQLVTLLAGFLVVRGLPVNDFAIYALITALQAALAVLSDTGITTLLVARAGKIEAQPSRLAGLVAAARHGRRRLELIVLGASAPLLWLWLRGKGLTGPELIGIAVILALSLHLQVSASLYISVPLILLDASKVQTALLAGAAIRLAGLGAIILIRPTYFWALAANLLALLAQAYLSRKYAASRIALDASKNEEDVRSFSALVRTQILNSIYYAFSSQITVWIIGVLGSRRSIAEVGALGRLGNVVALAQAVIATLVLPRFARMTEVASFRRRYVAVLGVATTAAVVLFALAVEAPNAFLWFLGAKYANLGAELPLAIGSAATYFVSTTLYALNASKAWIERTWIAVPLIVLVQLLAAFALEISSVRGAIVFGWLSALPPLVVNGAIAITRLRNWARETATPRP